MILRFLHLVCLISIVNINAIVCADSTKYSICISPYGDSGKCSPLVECTYLYSMILSKNLSSHDTDFLRRSQCNYDKEQIIAARRILVCCPDKYSSAKSQSKEDETQLGVYLPNPPVCGKVFQTRIYGGSSTMLDEFPWMALIKYKNHRDEFSFRCAASLINSRYLVTAAHCLGSVINSEWKVYKVRLGEWDLTTNPDCIVEINGYKDCSEHQEYDVELWMVHEEYKPRSRSQYHDIGLLRTAKNVVYNDFIKPICLPLSTELREKNFNGVTMEVAGWGMTELEQASSVKLKIRVNVQDASECHNKYNELYNITIKSDAQICAGGDNGVDSCRGDSGGPLMVTEREANREAVFLAGIVSFGSSLCGIKGWPSIYTRVDKHVDWIQGKLKA